VPSACEITCDNGMSCSLASLETGDAIMYVTARGNDVMLALCRA
jgi:hypothetical protein